MARYQLRRPAPVKIVPRRSRRQATSASSAPAPGATEAPEAEEEEEEADEGLESPDSPESSPSTAGMASESDDSESDDDEEPEEPQSPEAGEQAVSSGQPMLPSSGAPTSIPAPSTTAAPGGLSGARPGLMVSFSSQGNFAAAPQITASPSMTTTTRPANAATVAAAPTNNQASPPAQSENAGQNEGPQRSSPQEERTMITKGGAAAAITLSIIGALAIIVAAVVFIKRRKRRQYNRRLPDDPFYPGNTGSLVAPETAHVASDSRFGGGGSHLTRSTERSESLFGAAPYIRPETVSTERNRSHFPMAQPIPTPNPFADPPLNKAYDVLAGRPRSTTLTDRGSWVKNPFRNPESERFDPFGELQEKARAERLRYVEVARREAELEREEEMQRQFGMKEKMGLGVPEEVKRKGSGATFEGIGVLDRSGGAGTYRSV